VYRAKEKSKKEKEKIEEQKGLWSNREWCL